MGKIFQCGYPGCQSAGKLFTKTDLRRHQQTHLPNSAKPYKCSQCGRYFVQKCGLERHYKEIHQRLQFECKHCGARFQRYDDRRSHIRREHESSRPANDGNDRDADPSSASSSTSLPSFPPPIDNLASPASSFFVEYGAPFRSEGTSPLLSISPGPVPSFGATIHSAPSFTVESSVWLDGTGPGLPAPPRSNALFPSPIMMPTAPIPHLPTSFNPWHTSLNNWPSSVDAGLAQGQEFRSGMPQLSWEGDLAQTARVSDPTLLSTAGPSTQSEELFHRLHTPISFAGPFSAADQSAPAIRKLEPGASEPRMEWAEQNPLNHPQAPFPSAVLAEWRHDFDVPELDQRVERPGEERSEDFEHSQVPSSSAGATLVAAWPSSITGRPIDHSDLGEEQPEEGQTGDLPQASSSPADPNPVPEWPTPNPETLEFDDWEYWGEWLEQDPAYLNFDDLFN